MENTKTDKISLQCKDIESIYKGEFWNTTRQNHHKSNKFNTYYKNIIIFTNSNILVIGKEMVWRKQMPFWEHVRSQSTVLIMEAMSTCPILSPLPIVISIFLTFWFLDNLRIELPNLVYLALLFLFFKHLGAQCLFTTNVTACISYCEASVHTAISSTTN